MSTDTTTTKTRTITLTDRPPVTIREDDWPVIASGDADDDDSQQPGHRANRTWKRQIRVRQPSESDGSGRTLVYAIYAYWSAWQDEHGASARGGVLLDEPVTMAQIIAAIRSIATEMATAEAEAVIAHDSQHPQLWRRAAQACIADLPTEEL